MWLLLLLVVLLGWYVQSRPTDDETVIEKLMRANPNLAPVNTVSNDDGHVRMMFLDKKDYSGHLVDSA